MISPISLYNDLALEKKSSFLRKHYANDGYLKRKFGKDQVCFSGVDNISEFQKDYLDKINQAFNASIPSLERVHEYLSDDITGGTKLNTGINAVTQALYADDANDLYHDFIKSFIIKRLAKGRKFIFQKVPTIRVHCPKVSQNYRVYHSDLFLGHHPFELNIWIPLTKKGEAGHGFGVMDLSKSCELLESFNFNVDQLMSKSCASEAFHQKVTDVDVDCGEVLVFDSRLIHSALPIINKTRVSLDVRILFLEDKKLHPYQHRSTGGRKVLFEPGGYFSEEVV